jgi:hypothetical protein
MVSAGVGDAADVADWHVKEVSVGGGWHDVLLCATRRVRRGSSPMLPAPGWELVRACWELGGRPQLDGLRLRAWAHMLGFGGHWSTKSRRYSTDRYSHMTPRLMSNAAAVMDRLLDEEA